MLIANALTPILYSVAFDLAPGSRSQKALSRYVRTKKKFAGGPKTNLENPAMMSYGNAR